MPDIYIVVLINLIVWLGIFSYLFSLNTQINHLKRKLDNFESIKESGLKNEN